MRGNKMKRFEQIEGSIIELCRRCQEENCMDKGPKCDGYPEMKCAAIYVLDQMTTKDLYGDKMKDHMKKNVDLMNDAIDADFG